MGNSKREIGLGCVREAREALADWDNCLFGALDHVETMTDAQIVRVLAHAMLSLQTTLVNTVAGTDSAPGGKPEIAGKVARSLRAVHAAMSWLSPVDTNETIYRAFADLVEAG